MTQGPWKLPQGWQWKRLGQVCEINPRRPKGFARCLDAPTTFVPMSAVDEKTGTITKPEVVSYSKVSKGYTYFEKGDVLFAKITPCMQNGKHAIARNLIDSIGFGTTEFHVLRPNADVLPELVHHFIRQPHFLNEAMGCFTGSVGQQRVPDDFLSTYVIPLPPLSEQRRIVGKVEALFERIREAKGLREDARKDAQALLQSAMVQVFPRPGSPLPAGWRWVKLGELFDIQQGVAMSPRRRKGISPYPFLRTSNVLWGKVDLSELDEMDFSGEEINKLNLKSGDLLVCEGGEVGRTAVWRREIQICLYQNHIHRLRRCIENVVPDFYMYWMQAAFQALGLYKGEESRTTIPNLSVSSLKSFVVLFPPLSEQRRIVGYLDKVGERVRELKEKQAQTDAELNRLEQAILARAFRGEL